MKPRTWIIAALILVAAAAAFFILTRPAQPAALPVEISPSQAYEKYQQGAFFLDVREHEEWNAGHIPGATLIPLGSLPASLDSLPKDKEVVVVCRSGNRSASGRDALLQAGFSSVTSMAGGMNQWTAAGYPLSTGP